MTRLHSFVSLVFLWGPLLFGQTDLDNDGLPATWEASHSLDDNDDGSGNVENGPVGDPDGDGLNNIDEFLSGTDPRDEESDGDGFPDGYEVLNGFDPANGDDFPQQLSTDEVIGVETFAYPDGPIANNSGGLFWDFDNSTENDPAFGHTGTASDWDSTSGVPQIVSSSLVTTGTGAIREFNGTGEGDGSGSDERFGAIGQSSVFGAKVIYLRTLISRGNGTTWSGLSTFDFGSENHFFGVNSAVNPSSGNREFAIRISLTNTSYYTGIAPVPDQTYLLVAKLDYDLGLASLYLDPDLQQLENQQAPAVIAPLSGGSWTTAVRLASGGSGSVTWDDLQVSTSWEALREITPDAQDDSIEMTLESQARLKVLDNDRGAYHPPSLTILTPPLHGAATPSSDGSVLYEHTSGSPSSDSFLYEIRDFSGALMDTATVTIDFTGAWRYDTSFVAMPDSPPATLLEIVDAFPGVTFDSPHDFCVIPGDDQKLLVTEGDGKVLIIPDITATSPTKIEILDITSQVNHENNELAMKGIAAHPDWETNGYIFVTYNTTSGTSRLSRFTCSTTAPYSAANELVLIDQNNQGTIHTISTCQFGPDGYLYVGFGDEGTQNDGFNNSQHIDKDLWSCVIRIDVDKKPENLEPNPDPEIPRDGSGDAYFSIPFDNPFVGASSFNGITLNPSEVRTEIFLTGLRNPWQFSPVDTNNDNIVDEVWVGDVGRIAKEEIGVYAPGGNGGWGWREGDVAGQRAGDLLNGAPESAATLTEPIRAYNDDDGIFGGSAIIGGFLYEETAFPDLVGQYICADYISGNIWALSKPDAPGLEPEISRLGGEVAITAVGPDPNTGEILLLDRGNVGTSQGTGTIKRIRFAPENSEENGFPQTLSDTNFFADLTDLTPNPGGHAYEPNLTFWSDHAEKERWFLINDSTATVGYSEDDPWSFPEGMVWVKHFDYATEWESFTRTVNGETVTDRRPTTNSSRRRLETRFLVRNAEGVYGVSYRWTNLEGGSQFDASLVGANGEEFEIPITVDGSPTSVPWQIPARTSCLTCHTPEAGHALSYNTPQLNKEGSLSGVPGNFLSLLKLSGYLPDFDEDPDTLLRHLKPDETTYSLEARVRSYLAVNCAYCHQSNGTGGGNWDARFHLKLAETSLINGTPVEAPINPNDLLVIPGNIDGSIIYNRAAAANGYSRMPPLATNVVDYAGAQLLAEWIAHEAKVPLSYNDWRIAHFGNDTSPEGAPDSDPDSDTGTNHFEWMTNTDPNLSTSIWAPGYSSSGGNFILEIPGLSNRSITINHSTDLLNWSRWNVPGNGGNPLNPATTHEFSSPDLDREFFQFQIEER